MDFSIVSLQFSLNKICLIKKVPQVSNKNSGLTLLSEVLLTYDPIVVSISHSQSIPIIGLD